MGKRSRDASFSPPAQGSSSPDTGLATSPGADQGPPGKLIVQDSASSLEPVMRCSLPPHREPVAFDTLKAFDIHYAKEHTSRCSECGRNFPSAHILGLHIDESHNPLREALQERGEKTFACFVPDCDRKCSTWQKRRLHLIDKHGFPRDYNVAVVVRGIDKATSMLREGQRRRISTSAETTQSVGHRRRTSSLAGSLQPFPKTAMTLPETSSKHKRPKSDIDDLNQSMSALRFVPASVTRRQGQKS